MTTETLYLGVAREIITPKVGCHLYGYDPNIFSTSVNDDLTASAFYFKQGDTQALMLSVTICGINNEITERILNEISATIKMPVKNIIIHSTHTRSGPSASGSAGWGGVDVEYIEGIFIPQIIKAVKSAKENATPVKMGVAKGESLIGVNRREMSDKGKIKLGQNPEGIFDPEMTAISFILPDDKVKANIIHYGCHGTASGLNTEITRDWPGPMIDDLDKLSGGITAYFNGPEGDIGPRLKSGKTTGNNTVNDALELGKIASNDACAIYKTITEYSTPKLKVDTFEVKLPLETRIPYEQAKEEFEKYKDAIHNVHIAMRDYYQRIIKSYEENYVEIDGVPFTQTIITLGEVAFISFPHELFAEIGIKIKKAKVFENSLVLALSNGRGNYFPTYSEIPLGGYEVEMFKTKYVQPVSQNADDIVVAQTVENLKNLKNS